MNSEIPPEPLEQHNNEEDANDGDAVSSGAGSAETPEDQEAAMAAQLLAKMKERKGDTAGAQKWEQRGAGFDPEALSPEDREDYEASLVGITKLGDAREQRKKDESSATVEFNQGLLDGGEGIVLHKGESGETRRVRTRSAEYNEDIPDVVLEEGLDVLEGREKSDANKRWREEGRKIGKGIATHKGVARTLGEMDQVLATGMRKKREAAAQEYIKSLLAFQEDTTPDESFDIRDMAGESLSHNNEASIRMRNAEHVAAERERSRGLFAQFVNEATQATRERAGDSTTQEDVAVTLVGMLDRDLNPAEERQLSEIFSGTPTPSAASEVSVPATERNGEDRATGKDADAAEAGQTPSRRTRRVQRTEPPENLVTGEDLGGLLRTPHAQGPATPAPDEDRAEGFYDILPPEHDREEPRSPAPPAAPGTPVLTPTGATAVDVVSLEQNPAAQTTPGAPNGALDNRDTIPSPDTTPPADGGLNQAQEEDLLRGELEDLGPGGGRPGGTEDATPPGEEPPAPGAAPAGVPENQEAGEAVRMELLRIISGIDKTIDVDALHLREMTTGPAMQECMRNVLALRAPYINAELPFIKIEKENAKLRKQGQAGNITEAQRLEEDHLRAQYDAAKEQYDNAVKALGLGLASALGATGRGKDSTPETAANTEQARRIQAQVLVNSLATLDRDLCQARVDRRNENKERKLILQTWDWYKKLPRGYRIAMTMTISSAAIAGGALTFGLPAFMGGTAIAKWGLGAYLGRRALAGSVAGFTSMPVAARFSKWRVDEYTARRQTKQAKVVEGLGQKGLIDQPGTEDADNPFVALMQEGTGIIADEAQKNALWDQIQRTKEQVAAKQEKMLGQTRRRSVYQALGIGLGTGAVASILIGGGLAYGAEAFSAGTGGGDTTVATETGGRTSADSGAAGSGVATEGSAPAATPSAEGAGSRAGTTAAETAGRKTAGTEVKTSSPEAPVSKEAPRVRLIVDPQHSRSVQGAIINHFKQNPEIAKQFGWSGTDDLHNWAGHKAARLYMTHATRALGDSSVRAELKAGGYTEDIDGYGEMMRRIKSTNVEINMGTSAPGDESIRLVDLDTLKARPRVVPAAPEPATYRRGAAVIGPSTVRPTTVTAEPLAAPVVAGVSAPGTAETFSPASALRKLRLSPEQYQNLKGVKAKDLLDIFDEVEDRDASETAGPGGRPAVTDDPWYKFKKGELPQGWPKVKWGTEFSEQLRVAEAVRGYMKANGLAGDPTIEEFLQTRDITSRNLPPTVAEAQALEALDRLRSGTGTLARPPVAPPSPPSAPLPPRPPAIEVIPQGLSTQKQRLLDALVHNKNVPTEIRVNRLLQNYAAGTLSPEDMARYRALHGGVMPAEKYAELYRANLTRIEQGGMGGRNAHAWMRQQFKEMELQGGRKRSAGVSAGEIQRSPSRAGGDETAAGAARARPGVSRPAVPSAPRASSETIVPLAPGAEHPTTFLRPRTPQGVAAAAEHAAPAPVPEKTGAPAPAPQPAAPRLKAALSPQHDNEAVARLEGEAAAMEPVRRGEESLPPRPVLSSRHDNETLAQLEGGAASLEPPRPGEESLPPEASGGGDVFDQDAFPAPEPPAYAPPSAIEASPQSEATEPKPPFGDDVFNRDESAPAFPATEASEPAKKVPVYPGKINWDEVRPASDLLRQSQEIPAAPFMEPAENASRATEVPTYRGSLGTNGIRFASDLLAEQQGQNAPPVSAFLEQGRPGLDVEGLAPPKRDALDAVIYPEDSSPDDTVDALLRLYMGGEIKPEDIAKYHLAHTTTAFEPELPTEQGLADSYTQNLEEIVRGRITGESSVSVDTANGWLKEQLSRMSLSEVE